MVFTLLDCSLLLFFTAAAERSVPLTQPAQLAVPAVLCQTLNAQGVRSQPFSAAQRFSSCSHTSGASDPACGRQSSGGMPWTKAPISVPQTLYLAVDVTLSNESW